MLEREIAAGVPFSWFTADDAYGQKPGLRGWLEDQDIAYVMVTRRDDEVPSWLRATNRVDELIGRVRAGSNSASRGPRRAVAVPGPCTAAAATNCARPCGPSRASAGTRGPLVDVAPVEVATALAVGRAAGSWRAGRDGVRSC